MSTYITLIEAPPAPGPIWHIALICAIPAALGAILLAFTRFRDPDEDDATTARRRKKLRESAVGVFGASLLFGVMMGSGRETTARLHAAWTAGAYSVTEGTIEQLHLTDATNVDAAVFFSVNGIRFEVWWKDSFGQRIAESHCARLLYTADHEIIQMRMRTDAPGCSEPMSQTTETP